MQRPVGLLGEGLVVCQCGRGSFRQAHGGERGVRAHRLGRVQRKWRQLRLQPRGVPETVSQVAVPEAAMWAVASVTGT